TVYLPSPIEHAMPVTEVDAAMRYQSGIGRLDISRLKVSAGEPWVELAAVLDNLGAPEDGEDAQALFVDLTATATDVPFDRLAEFWPETLATDARVWVLDSLTKGVADRAVISVALRPSANGGTHLESLAGSVDAHGLDVNYLSTMAKITNARGSATFNDKRFDIRVESGDSAGGLKVTGGEIGLLDLHKDMQWADIKLDVEGPVPAALKLIDAEPLGFASDLGLQADTAEGQVAAKLSLRIPLKSDLLASEIEATASARLTDAGLKDVIFHKDISAGLLDLHVTNDGLSLKGNAELGGIPVQMSWSHDFRPGALFLDRYEVSGYIEEILSLGTLGIDVPKILARYMQGGVQANVSTTTFSDGRQALSARIDLANIQLAVPELGWNKPRGVPASGVLELRIDKDSVRDIPNFSLAAPDMEIKGGVLFGAGGTLERVNLNTVRTGLTDVSGSLTPTKEGAWEVVLRGESLDVGVLWDEMIGTRDFGAKADTQDQSPDEDEGDALVVNAAVDIRNLIIRKDRVLHDFIGTAYRDRGLWRKMDIVGVAGHNGSVEVMLGTGPKGLRYLSISSNDAGAALKTLDLYDNILGGEFDLKAAYTRPGKGAPLEGVVKVRDYAMIDAPMFTKLIGIMSLTGVLDALQGEGLNFDVLEAPFVLQDGVLQLAQARASGPSIGVTTSGKVDMRNHKVDLQGTVVPAYAINALLGKIPLIGELFTGKEKGGGLFAATYTMQGQGENVDIK
ncbi:MAG TPA: AsmA-like C-terminal domain-containing protein, partial [Magnetovibrio sp.]